MTVIEAAGPEQRPCPGCLGQQLHVVAVLRLGGLTQTPDFPEPARRLKMGAIWWSDDIRQWAKENRPK